MSLPHAPAELPGRTAGQSIRSVAGYGVLVALLMIALVASVVGLFATELVMRFGAGISPYADIVAKLRDASPALISNYEKAGFPADAISLMRRAFEIELFCLPAFFLIAITMVF